MPMVKVDLLDMKVTPVQKRRLAESLTKVVSETLGYRPGNSDDRFHNEV